MLPKAEEERHQRVPLLTPLPSFLRTNVDGLSWNWLILRRPVLKKRHVSIPRERKIENGSGKRNEKNRKLGGPGHWGGRPGPTKIAFDVANIGQAKAVAKVGLVVFYIRGEISQIKPLKERATIHEFRKHAPRTRQKRTQDPGDFLTCRRNAGEKPKLCPLPLAHHRKVATRQPQFPICLCKPSSTQHPSSGTRRPMVTKRVKKTATSTRAHREGAKGTETTLKKHPKQIRIYLSEETGGSDSECQACKWSSKSVVPVCQILPRSWIKPRTTSEFACRSWKLPSTTEAILVHDKMESATSGCPALIMDSGLELAQ